MESLSSFFPTHYLLGSRPVPTPVTTATHSLMPNRAIADKGLSEVIAEIIFGNVDLEVLEYFYHGDIIGLE
jgi:hypothetical protein